MALREMPAIEYNVWLTLMKLLSDNVPLYLTKYGLSNMKQIKVLPSYPRDLSKYEKPAIIIQNISDDTRPLAFGGFIGQYYNDDADRLEDVVCHEHRMTMQIDVATDNNTQCRLFTSLIIDKILNHIKYSQRNRFTLYDFTGDIDNPTEMGFCQFYGGFKSIYFNNQYLSMSDRDYTNHDYSGIVRIEIRVCQLIVPKNEYVDMAKWIKITQNIIIDSGGNTNG